jgi:hypothetical protein
VFTNTYEFRLRHLGVALVAVRGGKVRSRHVRTGGTVRTVRLFAFPSDITERLDDVCQMSFGIVGIFTNVLGCLRSLGPVALPSSLGLSTAIELHIPVCPQLFQISHERFSYHEASPMCNL